MDTSNLDRIFVKHYVGRPCLLILSSLTVLQKIWLSGTLVADLIITGSMVAVVGDIVTYRLAVVSC